MQKKQKRVNPPFNVSDVVNNIIAFACSNIVAERTDGKPDNVPSGWITESLIRYGSIGYLHSESAAEGFYNVRRAGTRDRYGTPTQVYARTCATDPASFVATVGDQTGEMAFIRANPQGTPPIGTIIRYAAMINACDIGTLANTIAALRTQLLVTSGEPEAVDAILSSVYDGLPAIIDANNPLSDLHAIDISAEFVAPAYHALATTLTGDCLKMFGGVSPAQYKAERVQAAEVSAQIAASIDNVYIMIDTANADMQRQNVPYRLKYVGFGAKYEEAEE